MVEILAREELRTEGVRRTGLRIPEGVGPRTDGVELTEAGAEGEEIRPAGVVVVVVPPWVEELEEGGGAGLEEAGPEAVGQTRVAAK